MQNFQKTSVLFCQIKQLRHTTSMILKTSIQNYNVVGCNSSSRATQCPMKVKTTDLVRFLDGLVSRKHVGTHACIKDSR